MKLSNLKNKLEEKKFSKVREIKKIFRNDKGKLDDMKIIGITGSCGKSTTAYIIHKYLKLLGYKSVLYSSIMVDSPASHIKKNEAYEVSVSSENSLLSVINEAAAYGSDFLVLEVNDSTLSKGILKDVPFDVRVLTNLNPKHNLEDYTKDEYVSLKKSFFENIDNDCTCVLGFQDYEEKLFDELIASNNYSKLTFSSNYIVTKKEMDSEKITCLLHELESTLDGLKMAVRINGVSYKVETKLIMSYNALNFVCAMTTLKALGLLSIEKFNKCINDIKIPGRTETFYVNGRLIIVDAQMSKILVGLKNFKEKELINRIIVVTGSIGSGYKYWVEKFNSGKHFETRNETRKYASGLLKQYADLVYLTENDNGAESVLDICTELQNNLNGCIPSSIIEDRESAIRQAILNSREGDAILISGRGNRRILCNSKTTMKLVKDSEVIEQILEDLRW